MSYSASYRHKGDTLAVKRVFTDRTKGNVCSPTLFTAYKEFAIKAMQDVKAQVLYK